MIWDKLVEQLFLASAMLQLLVEYIYVSATEISYRILCSVCIKQMHTGRVLQKCQGMCFIYCATWCSAVEFFIRGLFWKLIGRFSFCFYFCNCNLQLPIEFE
jgi:hypothetical protein